MYHAKVVIVGTGATQDIAIEKLHDKIAEMQEDYVENSQFFTVEEVDDTE